MRTMIFLPPLPRMTGGLAMLLRLGGFLARAGYDVSFVARTQTSWMEEGVLPPGVPLVWWNGDNLPLDPEDIWLVPEGWPHGLLPGLRAQARTVVYVQNWAYLLSEWPADLRPEALPAHYLAVSLPVAWHVKEATGKDAEILRPGIDTTLFRPNGEHMFAVAWMPRKNKALARQIREIVTAWRMRRHAPLPDWVEIHNMSQAEVAHHLRSCSIFLATGFPEGCPLPPLEAMASGCVGVGFSGFGGWDYMRRPSPDGSAPCMPDWLPKKVRENARALPVNGFWVSDGDVTSAALALDRALDRLAAGGDDWERLVEGGLRTAAAYSLEEQEARVLALWDAARRGELFV